LGPCPCLFFLLVSSPLAYVRVSREMVVVPFVFSQVFSFIGPPPFPLFCHVFSSKSSISFRESFLLFRLLDVLENSFFFKSTCLPSFPLRLSCEDGFAFPFRDIGLPHRPDTFDCHDEVFPFRFLFLFPTSPRPSPQFPSAGGRICL